MVLLSLNCYLGTWISINNKQSEAIKHSFYKTRLVQIVFEPLCINLYVYTALRIWKKDQQQKNAVVYENYDGKT